MEIKKLSQLKKLNFISSKSEFVYQRFHETKVDVILKLVEKLEKNHDQRS